MKSRLHKLTAAAVTVCVVGVGALSGCSSSEPTDDRPILAAAFGPLAWAAQQVGSSEYRVVNLTQPGVEAHEVELGIQAMADIERADVVLILSGFQVAVDRAAEAVAQGTVLDVADVADLVPADEHESGEGHLGHDHGADEHGTEEHGTEEHGDEHADHEDDAPHPEEALAGDEESHAGHDHGDVDPHFWQDPVRMAAVVDALADQLSTLHPGQSATFRARAAEVRAQLTTLDNDFRTGLAGCARDTVVVSHEAFGYLAKYGLHFESINGLSPGAEPSPADLARLQQLIRTDSITTVFSEARATQKLAETLANDTGVTTAVLDPLEAVGNGAQGDYLTIMRRNLDALRKANGCR